MFYLVYQGLGLLINLVELSGQNLKLLLSTPTVAPFDQYPSISGSLNVLEALGMVFLFHFVRNQLFQTYYIV